MNKYYIVISNKLVGSFLDVLFLSLAVILSELHQKPRRKDLVTAKNTQKNLCEGHHFFDCTSSFLCHFLLLSSSTPFPLPKWCTCLMFLIKIRNIAVGGIPCDDIMSERSKMWNSLAINTSWLAFLRKWYYFKFCFSSSFSG